MTHIGATPPPTGPQGPTGPAPTGKGENITRTVAGLLKILAALLAGVNTKILPELRYSEAVARMFAAVFGIMTKGSYPATSWSDNPGVQVANQETMGQFLKAWLFFLAATGGSKPPGVSDKEWKEAVAMVKKHPIPPKLLADMKAILNDPAFQQLAKDVIENANVFADWSKWAAKRRGLFSGEDRKQYDKYQRQIEEDQEKLWNLPPGKANDKERARLNKDITKMKGKQEGLAKKDGVTAQFNEYTQKMDTDYKERLEIMNRVRDKDIAAIQKGRMPPKGSKAPVPTAKEQERYNRLTGDSRELSTYANAGLNKWKVIATYYAKMIGKLGPLISKFLKAIEKVAQLIRDKTQS